MIITQHFKLNIGAWTDGLGEVRIYLNLSNITNLQYCTQDVTEIDLTYEWDGTRELSALINDDWELYDDNNIMDLVVSPNDFIEFDAEISIDQTNYQNLLTAIQCGLITMGSGGKTLMLLYRLNDEKESVSKNLTFVNILSGNFKAPLGIKNIEIDVIDYNLDKSYNYVFIPILNRFYYITNIQLVNKDYTRLIMQEDVLMSWKDLIKQQSGYISRYEYSNNYKVLVDDRKPMQDKLTVVYSNGTATTTDNKVNTTLSINTQDLTIPNFLAVTRSKFGLTTYSFGAITKSLINNLPDLAPHNAPNQRCYFMPYTQIGSLIDACLKDDATASYLDSIIYLPFNPITPFNLESVDHNHLYIGDKQLNANTNTFIGAGDPIATADQPECTYEFTSGTNTNRTVYQSPYLCIFDGKFEINNDLWQNHEPYSNYELNIPFVGLIQLNSYDFLNQRILVYYSFDLKSGNATAYVYNTETNKIIWSGTCQLGVKLDITTTNLIENVKQKQSADLNMILGLLTSALSVGVGIATENPVAIAGGVLSAGKTVASNVNTKRMLFSRGQTTYGSSDGSLYTNLSVYLKRSYHAEIELEDNPTYAHLHGYPYNQYEGLSELHGYVEIPDIHFNAKGENIYNDEIVEIVQLLKNGVII